jgi:hypothetical protein
MLLWTHVNLEWMNHPEVRIALQGEDLVVTACPSLSHLQVVAACALLEAHGQAANAQWRRVVGLPREPD